MNKTILITGFEPFGGENINPTQMIVNELPDVIDGFFLKKIVLPVEFIKAPELAIKVYEECQPQAVIMLGQAGGRKAITPERIAKNEMHTNEGRGDNINYQPVHLPIDENGPAILESSLPIEEINEAINEINVPSEISNDAGTFVCNALFYSLLNYNKNEVPTGFIHVPFIKEQGLKNNRPYLDYQDIYQGIIAAIKVVITKINKNF